MKAFRFSLSPLAMLAAAAVATVVALTPAHAQDVQSLAETVSRLERQLQTLERNIYRGGGAPAAVASGTAAPAAAPPAAGTAQLNVRIGEIEEQLRQLTGDVERVGFEVRQMSTRLDKVMTDVDFRLRTLERGAPASGAAPAESGASTPVVASAPPAASTAAVSLPAGAPAAQYEYAFAYLMRRDFPGAEEAFRQFVAANPNDPLAGNAQYWLGETYYVRNEFPAAARTFAEGFQRYPDSGKAADNLLKLGLSLAALERKDDACITFAKLSTAYPGAPANILQRAKRERDKHGCG